MPPIETPLRRWLDQWDLSMERFARLCDVSNNTIALVSRGARRPTDDLKVKIYKASHGYESANGAKKPKGIHPIDWFDTDLLGSEPANQPAAPVKEPGKVRDPGKRVNPAKAAPAKRKAR